MRSPLGAWGCGKQVRREGDRKRDHTGYRVVVGGGTTKKRPLHERAS